MHHLRSVEKATVGSFGNFNVLIGKNNSGKSNVLAAIDHFFRFAALETLATHQSSLTREVDFFTREASLPIEIMATLRPQQQDLINLFSQIGEEYPQVAKALPDAESNDLLCVELQFILNPHPLAYVRRICSISAIRQPGTEERPLLEVSPQAAEEIAGRSAKLAEAEQDLVALEQLSERFDVDDWERIRQARHARSYLLPSSIRAQLSSSGLSKLISQMEESRDVAEARVAIQAQKLNLESFVDDTRTASLTNPLRAYAGDTSTVPKYITYLLAELQGVRVLHLQDRRRQIGEAEAARVLQLKMSRGGEVTLDSIKATVNSLLGVAIDAFTGETSNPSQSVISSTGRRIPPRPPKAELDVDQFLVEVNGSGIREALRLVLDLEFEKPQILLVEEPEVHLHPALEVAMMRHLKAVSAETQVFLTTHSTNFLDTGDMQNVYMIRKEAGTEVRHLDLESVENELPKELGLRLSSIFMFDRLVFVEGITDELVLRTFAETLGYNLSRANVGFVVMGSARNFTHYAAKATMSLLSKRKVKSIFVLDRDERSEEAIAKLTEQLGGDAQLHVLKKREIENYLIDDGAISELINRRLRSKRSRTLESTTEDIQDAIQGKADELRDLGIAKRVASSVCGVYRARRDVIFESYSGKGLARAASDAVAELQQELNCLASAIPEIVNSAEQEVESKWASSKLAIAPGAEVLDGVFSTYGLRYRKDRDASDLAELIRRDAVPEEIRALLGRVCGD